MTVHDAALAHGDDDGHDADRAGGSMDADPLLQPGAAVPPLDPLPDPVQPDRIGVQTILARLRQEMTT